MDSFYNSETNKLLNDKSTKLYKEVPEYVYSLYNNEINNEFYSTARNLINTIMGLLRIANVWLCSLSQFRMLSIITINSRAFMM